MMEREEFEKRYRQAEFNSMAYMCEHGLIKPEQNSSEPTTPTWAQIMLKAAGIKPTPDTHMPPEDRLRRYAGLK